MKFIYIEIITFRFAVVMSNLAITDTIKKRLDMVYPTPILPCLKSTGLAVTYFGTRIGRKTCTRVHDWASGEW